jgi:glutamine amidotransferase
MCILVFMAPGVMPDERKLENCAENNPDGNGFAIVDRDRIITRRSMDHGAFIPLFAKLRRQYPDGPAMWHSRIATAGVVGKSNCHPFRVGTDPKTVVGHNGILPRQFWPGKGDERSDTAILAARDLPMRNFDGPRSMRKLSRLVGTDKLVILTVNPRWRERAYLVGEQYGHWVGDTWYSNHSYSAYTYTAARYQYPLTECATEGCRVQSYYRHCVKCLGERAVWGLCAFAGCTKLTPERYCIRHDGYRFCMVWQCTMHAEAGSEHCAEHGDITAAGWSEPVLVTRSPHPCTQCLSPNAVSTVTQVCTVCNMCNDCNESAAACLCYVPAQLDRDPATLDGHTVG